MVKTMKGAILNAWLALALLLGGVAALTGGQSAEAQTWWNKRADVVFERGYWTRGNTGYIYSVDVTNRGNLPAHGVVITVNVYESSVQPRYYEINVGQLAVGERKRYAVWFAPGDEKALIRVVHDGIEGDRLWLTTPKVRDHRT